MAIGSPQDSSNNSATLRRDFRVINPPTITTTSQQIGVNDAKIDLSVTGGRTPYRNLTLVYSVDGAPATTHDFTPNAPADFIPSDQYLYTPGNYSFSVSGLLPTSTLRYFAYVSDWYHVVGRSSADGVGQIDLAPNLTGGSFADLLSPGTIMQADASPRTSTRNTIQP